jgi:hypothetical protein
MAGPDAAYDLHLGGEVVNLVNLAFGGFTTRFTTLKLLQDNELQEMVNLVNLLYTPIRVRARTRACARTRVWGTL